MFNKLINWLFKEQPTTTVIKKPHITKQAVIKRTKNPQYRPKTHIRRQGNLVIKRTINPDGTLKKSEVIMRAIEV